MNLYIKKKVLLLLTAIFICSSCNLLEENPQSFIDPEAFFKTPGDAQSAVNAVYNILNRIGPQTRNIMIMADVSGDDLFPLAINNDRVTIDQATHTPANGVVVETWRNMYIGVTRANTAIERIPLIDMDQALKDKLVGEAKFLRALYYFYLVRFWGNVPLVVKETKSLSTVEKPVRSSESEIYDQIIKDLEEAIIGLPEADAKVRDGRATKGSAQALLAKVHLTLKNWSKAAELSKQVIDSKKYNLWPHYAQAFAIENENGAESVFEIQFLSGGFDQGSATPTYFARENGPVQGRGFGSFQPTVEIINLMKADSAIDERFDTNLKKDVDKKYYVNKYVDENSIAYPEADNNFPVIRYAEVLLIYAEALNELGPDNTEAYDAINQIRKRARRNPTDPTHLPDLAGLSQTDFRNAVYKERRYELAFESQRWFDLKRTGLLIPILKQQGISNVQDYHVNYPIPQDEISLNANLLPQNDGY